MTPPHCKVKNELKYILTLCPKCNANIRIQGNNDLGSNVAKLADILSSNLPKHNKKRVVPAILDCLQIAWFSLFFLPLKDWFALILIQMISLIYLQFFVSFIWFTQYSSLIYHLTIFSSLYVLIDPLNLFIPICHSLSNKCMRLSHKVLINLRNVTIVNATFLSQKLFSWNGQFGSCNNGRDLLT